MFDFIITNGLIIDGTGQDAYTSDIAIKDEKIVAIGDLKHCDAEEVLDAHGAYVCPGFIDIHTHIDMTICVDPRSVNQIRQGVTSQLGGLCGYSFVPLNEKGKKAFKPLIPGKNPAWENYQSFIHSLEELNLGTNIGSFIGHGSLRLSAMDDPVAPMPTKEELAIMLKLLEDSIEQGAFGMSTGLEYNPGKAAEIFELESLCHVLTKYGALHTTHPRNRDKFYITAINEMIDVTRATSARLQISHINPKYGCHESTMQDLYDMINHARKAGFIVNADCMGTQWNHTAALAIMPLWAQNLPAEELLALLKSKEGRLKLQRNPNPIWQLTAQEKWDRVYQFCGVKTKSTCGMSLAEIAKQKNCTGFDALCYLLAEEAPAFNEVFLTSDAFSLKSIAIALDDPFTCVISDVIGLAKDGPLADEVFSPNTYDWVLAFFNNFVIGKNPHLSFEAAVAKLTSLPAMLVGITDRGKLEPHYYADITIINKNKLKSMSSLKDPNQYPQGIEAVFVNGKVAYKQGDDTIHCHGQPLKFQRR